jgi:TonB family protein
VRVATSSRVHGWTIVASVGVHAVLAGLAFWIALRSLPSDPALATVAAAEAPSTDPSTVSVELPVVGEGVRIEEARIDPTGDPPRIAVARLDTGKAGAGGDRSADSPALNLADADDHLRLSPDLLSRIDRDQLQRLRVSRARRSWEDRRSTTHPMELTLLVTGPGSLLERRPVSPASPDRGALESPTPRVLGGAVGGPGDEGEGALPLGGSQLGTITGAPGAGLFDARPGEDHRASAPVASARPDVVRGLVAIPAVDPARPRDDVDSDQEVATTVRSLVHASTSGGSPGDGRGGNAAAGDPGAGASEGSGSRARPLGVDEGDVLEYWTSDPRLLPYFRQLHAKIDPLWKNAFPKSALLELKQGTVILQFTVRADGSATVRWPPVRPSGVDEFDRNCADAIRRAAPFPPIPRELGVSSLTIRAPFVANNPVVK